MLENGGATATDRRAFATSISAEDTEEGAGHGGR